MLLGVVGGPVQRSSNQESKYFEILIKLFDHYLKTESIPKAAEVLERLVDIDSYDYRNQERVELIRREDRRDNVQTHRRSRLAKSASPGAGSPSARPEVPSSNEVVTQGVTEASRESQTLEDLIVQTEIFLQYSLHNKALDRLQKIGLMFPGEERRNARLSALYQLANWWPPGANRLQPPVAATSSAVPAAPVAVAPVRPHQWKLLRLRRFEGRSLHCGNFARPFEDFGGQPENFPPAVAQGHAEHRRQQK